MLLKFKKFVDEILSDNSRTHKLAVLDKYKEDEDIRYLLKFIYDPYIITGISSKKINKNFSYSSNFYFANFRELLEYIKEHNTGRDEDINVVQTSIAKSSAFNYKDLAIKIITKDLPLGIDSKTINKVIPGLISEFNVQLSEKYFDRPSAVEGKEFAITTKIDGSRIIAMKDKGNVTFWTRQGQQYIGLVDLETELKNITEDNFIFDGELVAIDTDLEDTYKQTMKLSRTKETEKHGLQMLVFDYMPLGNFKLQWCPIAYKDRRAWLSTIFDSNSFKFFKLLPILYKGTDTNKIIEILDEQTSQGQEGIMINITNAPYSFKRTWNLCKVKKMQSLDLEVIGFEEGTNSNKGTLGALLVRYKDNNLVKVGSGFEKALRDTIWLNKADWLGRIIEVQYFEETTNANGGKSIRFPVYKDYRTDKIEPDY